MRIARVDTFEPMFTIAPPPWAIIIFAASRDTWNRPTRFTRSTFSNNSSGVSSKRVADPLQHGVVDQHVEPAGALADHGEQSLDGRRIGDVGRGLDEPLEAARLQLRDRAAHAIGRGAVDEHRGPFRGKPRGNSQTCIPAGAGDQDNLVGESHHKSPYAFLFSIIADSTSLAALE